MEVEIREMKLRDFFKMGNIKFDPENAPYFWDTIFTPKNISFIGQFYRKVNLFLSLLIKKSFIGYYVVLALVNKKPVGVCWMTILENKKKMEKKGTIGIFVNDGYRGGGVGTNMLKKLTQYADAHNIRLNLTVYDGNKGALHLYKKFGFKKEKTLWEMERK